MCPLVGGVGFLLLLFLLFSQVFVRLGIPSQLSTPHASSALSMSVSF